MRTGCMRFLLVALVIALAWPAARAAAQVDAEQQATVNKAVDTVNRFAVDPEMQWLRNHVGAARGLLIVPVSLKGGFFVGASGGVGVFLARGPANVWSDPAFYQLASVSFGLQIGGDVSEIIMLVMTDRGRDALLTTELKLGGEISVAAGPIGAGAEAQTADVLAFSRTKGGVYGGLNVEGTVIHPKGEWNGLYYGRPVTPGQILIDRAVTNPKAAPLRTAVGRLAGGG